MTLTGLLLLGVLAPVSAEDRFERVRRDWEVERKRASLALRTKAHDALASTEDVRALSLLRKAYRDPAAPSERKPPAWRPDLDGPGRPDQKLQEQYLIASIATARCRKAAHASAYAAWRRQKNSDRDAWLWYQSLRVDAELGRTAPIVDAARKARSPWLRAAALEVLAAARAQEALAIALEMLEKLPSKDVERSLALEGVASVALALKGHQERSEYRLVLTKLIRQLDDKATPARTRLVIARHLQLIFATEDLHYDARSWLRHLLGRPEPSAVDHGRYAPPKRTYFFGLRATGDRIAYVIDTSSSMFTAISPDELEALKKIRRPPRPAPTTGPGAGRAGRRGKGRKLPDRLPWEQIKTRYDAARECLKFSLQGLDAGQYFTVIRFASDAGFLAPVDGMLPATDENIRRVESALDAGSEETLGGSTNMHGGLRRAFKVRAKGMTERWEYVDPGAFLEGCDTIFLLSDGMPCWDDWAASVFAGVPAFSFDRSGPTFANYWTPHQLVDDLERLNLFRRAEIHCVGIGQPNMPLLKRIAAIGRGKAIQVGGDGDPWSLVADVLRKRSPAQGQIEMLRRGATEGQRTGAAHALAAMHAVDAAPALIDALGDASVHVRRAADRALREIGQHDIPFDAEGDFDARRKAQRAWRAWFAANETALRKRWKSPPPR